MRGYNLVLLLKSDLKRDQKDKVLEDIKKLLGGAKESKVESMGEKKLSYSIKGQRSGEYVVLNFESDKVDLDFNKRIGIKEEVLRHILVRN